MQILQKNKDLVNPPQKPEKGNKKSRQKETKSQQKSTNSKAENQ